MPVTADETIQDLLHPFQEAMDAERITPKLLARKLKAELSAKSSKTIKIKGAPGQLPKGYKTITTTGIIEKIHVDGCTEKDYCDGESVLGWDEVDWGTRQKARIDAHKLRGDYPAEKHDHAIHGEISMLLQEIDGSTLGPPSQRGEGKP